MAELIVSPSDCALALAIPLDREAFHSDLAAESPREFAKANVGKWERPEHAWRRYRPVIEAAERAIATLQSAGGSVLRDASLEDLREAFERRAVVTLVAHWRFDPIVPEDILDPAVILDRIRSPRDELQRFVSDTVAEALPAEARQLVSAGSREGVAMLLSAATRAYESSLDALKPSDMGSKQPRSQPMSRLLLESAFSDVLRAGRVVELAGGFCSAAELIATIPAGYSGVVDLSICNSLVLAERIKRERPSCLVVANRRRARPDLRLLRYRYVIRALNLQPARYTDIVVEHSLFQLGR